MKKIIVLLVAMTALFSFSIASAATQSFMFYIDAEGAVDYDSKDMEKIIKPIREKLPEGVVLHTTPVASQKLDVARITAQGKMVNQLRSYPEYEAITPGVKSLMSDDLLQSFLRNQPYDGVIILRLKPTDIKLTPNVLNSLLIGFGGNNTEMEIQTSIIVYTKAQGTVFNNTQLIKTKVSGTFAPVAASTRAVPEAMKNINIIKTTR